MSLINDALKRAESEKRAAKASAPTPPLQPVESTPASRTSPLLLGGIFLLGLGAIGMKREQIGEMAELATSVKRLLDNSPVSFDKEALIGILEEAY